MSGEREELIARLRKMRGDFLGDGVNPGVRVSALLRALSSPPPAAGMEPADWEIDNSTESPILTYKKCSVIQDEQAHYVLGLIRAAAEEPEPYRSVRAGRVPPGWPTDHMRQASESATNQPPVAQRPEALDGGGAAAQDAKVAPEERPVSNRCQSPQRQCDTGSARGLATSSGDHAPSESAKGALPWQAIDDADLRDAEQRLLGALPRNAMWIPEDANTLANIALHCIREVRATRAGAKGAEQRHEQGKAVKAELDEILAEAGGLAQSKGAEQAAETLTDEQREAIIQQIRSAPSFAYRREAIAALASLPTQEAGEPQEQPATPESITGLGTDRPAPDTSPLPVYYERKEQLATSGEPADLTLVVKPNLSGLFRPHPPTVESLTAEPGPITRKWKRYFDATTEGRETEARDAARLDFVIERDTSWYPGRAPDGVAGILCYDFGGGRTEAVGLTMRDAIDAAINAQREN